MGFIINYLTILNPLFGKIGHLVFFDGAYQVELVFSSILPGKSIDLPRLLPIKALRFLPHVILIFLLYKSVLHLHDFQVQRQENWDQIEDRANLRG